MAYSLSILGQPSFQGPNGPIRYSATKAQALLWHLAAQPETAFSRSHITNLLWPDDSESEGRNRLNTTLSRLRQSMPVCPIRQNGDMLQWDRYSGVALDTLRFLEISRAVGLESSGQSASGVNQVEAISEAVSLWRGPLLQGFVPTFSSTYEEWLEQERLLWERRILEALARLVQLEEGRSAWGRVIAHSQQALAIDPLQERFHRWLMVAYYQAGERGAALNQYTQCAQIIQAQLGATPDPATTRLRDQIAGGEIERAGSWQAAPTVGAQAAAALIPEAGSLSARDLQVLGNWSGRPATEVAADSSASAMGQFALIDPLTGLYNRRYLETLLELEIRSGNAPVIALLDMKGLRRVNDTLGLERGDSVLRTCAAYFREELPQGVVSRMGGGSFAVLFPSVPVDVAAVLVQQAVAGLSASLVIPDLRGSVEFAAGIAAYPEDAADALSLQRTAEVAVHWAKKHRARRVVLARDLMATSSLEQTRSPEFSAALIGRESLWERMQMLLDQAAAGRGQMLVLEGTPGSGKSRLIAELAQTARLSGWRVVQVAPSPSGALYEPVSEALKALTGREPQGLPDDPYGQVRALAGRLMEEVGHSQPVLICIDDLHEAGNLTALALTHMSWKLHHGRVMVALALETGANTTFDWSSLTTIGAATQRLVREQLLGLDLNGTRRLALAQLGSTLAGPAVRVLHEMTGGNPLQVIQVLKAWTGTGILTPGPSGWTLDFEAAVQAPRDLLGALTWRMGQLEPDVQELLGLAAVLGREFHTSDLRRLSSGEEELLKSGLEQAVQEWIIAATGPDLYRFTHPLLREAAYTRLNPLTRRLAHGLAGLLLVESGGAHPGQLARHFDAAGMPERSFAYHIQAGEEAEARRAYVTARHHLTRAWQVLPGVAGVDPSLQERLPLALSRVMLTYGDRRAAVDTCREALQRSGLPSATQAALLLGLGRIAMAEGDGGSVLEVLERAEALREQLDPADSIRLAALRSRYRLWQSQTADSLAEVLRQANEAARVGDPTVEGLLLSDAARAMLALGQSRSDVYEVAQRAVARLPIGSGPAAPVARLTTALAAATTREALPWVHEALEAAIFAGETGLLPHLLHMIGRLERASGSWLVARRVFEAALVIGARTGSVADRCATMGEMALMLAWMGEQEEAQALIITAVQMATSAGLPHLLSTARVQLARCLIAAGKPREALRSLGEGGPRAGLEYHLALLDGLIQAGELHRAVVEAAGLPKPQGEQLVYHALLLGRLARRQGRPQEALRWLNQAIAQAERPFAEQYEIAQAYGEQAYALHALGDVEAAEKSLQAAKEWLSRVNVVGIPIV
ncbi:MAG: BTAD domain-containing putative transcriptional regulator [Bacillota bacterium]